MPIYSSLREPSQHALLRDRLKAARSGPSARAIRCVRPRPRLPSAAIAAAVHLLPAAGGRISPG